jgi:hypothetical protein
MKKGKFLLLCLSLGVGVSATIFFLNSRGVIDFSELSLLRLKPNDPYFD